MEDLTPMNKGPPDIHEEEEEGDDDYETLKKRLFVDDTLETPMKKDALDKQPVLVYLRIRPKNQQEITSKLAECLHQSGEHELLAVAPKSSQTYKNKLKSSESIKQQFTFTKIFNHATTQKDLFDETMRPMLKDFFDGQSCLVFTYGVTNSGKTYTVTGPPSDPGILPRSLDVVYNSIDPKQLMDIPVKPKHFSEVTYLSEEEQQEEERIKEKVLNMAREAVSSPTLPAVASDETMLLDEQNTSTASTLSKASSNMSKLTDIDNASFEDYQHDESSIEFEDCDNQQFSLWVSFAEIYNEFIYDLLVEPPTKARARTCLKIREDKNSNQFIKGLREIRVNNVEEAMLLLRLGQRHRHVAHTRLNYQSSRSHSVYTIKLIRVVKTNKPRPEVARVNRISIVDLAGAERSAKTGATGVRIKEAGNINNSLLALGKCIEAMRHNQSRKGSSDEHIVPYRDSKLTRLLHNYFFGKGRGARQGKITMFVNVSNVSSVFDETIHVLKFSAIASKIIPMVKPVVVHNTRHHRVLNTSTCPQPFRHKALTSNTPAVGQCKSKKPPHPPVTRPQHCQVTEEVTATVDKMPVLLEEPDGDSQECKQCKVLVEQLISEKNQVKKKLSELQVEMFKQECIIRQEVTKEFHEQLTEIEEQYSNELEAQAEEFEAMYGQRFKNLQKSMKKQYSRKRRRPNDDDDDTSDQCLRTEVADLKEKVAELESELKLERNRAAAEIHDLSETNETKVVNLNQQLAEMSLKLSAASNTEKQLRADSESLNMKYRDLEYTNQTLMRQVEEMSAAMEAQKQREFGECRSEVKQGSMEEGDDELREECKILKHQFTNSETKLLEVTSQASDAAAEVEILQARISELIAEKALMSTARRSLESRLVQLQEEQESNKDEVLLELQSELSQLKSHNLELDSQHKEGLTKLQNQLDSQHKEEVTRLQTQLSTLRDELMSTSAKLAVNKETIYRLETTQETNESELTLVRQQLEEKTRELVDLQGEMALLKEENTTLSSDLKETVKKTLHDYETTLKNQSTHIQQLEGEREMIHSHNEELEQKCTDLEFRLNRVTVSRDALSTRIEELTRSLDDSRRTFSQRENELLESSDNCRSVLEEQVSDFKKQCATLEHELTSTKEDMKILQKELKAKESELLSLAKSVGSERTEHGSLVTQLEEAKKEIEAKEASLKAIQGHHQLEVAQQSIKMRELSEELEARMEEMEHTRVTFEEEMTAVKENCSKEVDELNKEVKQMEKKLLKLKATDADLKSMKKSCQQLKKELDELKKTSKKQQDKITSLENELGDKEQELDHLKMTSERELESVKEEWGKEVEQLRLEKQEPIYEVPPELPDDDRTIYESIIDTTSTESRVSVTVSQFPPPSTGTVLKPVESTSRRSYLQAMEDKGSSVTEDLDASKPFIPVLERSSQLMEDTIVDESKPEIDVTPLPVRKKARKAKAKSTKKRSIHEVNTPNKENNNSPAAKKTKYTTRSRKKPQKLLSSNIIAQMEESSSLNEFTPASKKNFSRLKQIIGNKKTKTSIPSVAQESIASRTRQKRRVRKSQISGPVSLLSTSNSDMRLDRPAIESRGYIQLGGRLKLTQVT